MSLYDRYQQSNSSVIPQFEGSNGEDFVKVGMYRQGQYDTAREAGMETGDAAGNLNVSGSGLHGVDAAASDLRSEVEGHIQQLTDKGDWENAIPDVKALGRHFANRSAEIMAPINALATYKKGLEKEGLDLTPGQKDALVGMSVDAYNRSGGLQKNPRGQYQGTSIGVNAAKNIDVNKKVNQILEGIAPSSEGYSRETTSDGALWIKKDGRTVKTLTKQQVADTVNAGLANDEEYQAHLQQEGNIAGYYAGKYRDPNNAPEGTLKMQALKLQVEHPGLSFDQAFSHVASQATRQQIHSNALQMANKRAFHDISTESGIKVQPYTMVDYEAKAKIKAEYDVLPPMMSQGANTKVSTDQQDYHKASTGLAATQANIQQNQDNIKGWNTLLVGTKDPAARTQLQTNIAQAQNDNAVLNSGVTRAKQIQGQAQIEAAQQMGYKDYDDFLKNGTGDIDKLISTSLGDKFSHIKTASGRYIDRGDIREAIATGRAKVEHFTPVAYPGAGNTQASVSGVTLTLKDGTQIPIPNNMNGEKLGNAIDAMSNDKASRLSDFNSRVKATYKDNVANLSIGSTNIDIPNPKERESLTNMLKSNIDGVTFTNPGEIEKEKAPDNFRVISASTAGASGETRLKIEVLDADGKSTGKYQDAVSTNNNFAENIARQLEVSSAPEAKLAAVALRNNSPARQMESMVPGSTIPVPTEGGDQLYVRMNKGRNGKVVWNLVDDQGDIKDTKTTSAEAGLWFEGLPAKTNPKSYVRRPSP